MSKGESVGADAQITKPELGRVVELADRLAGVRYLNREQETTGRKRDPEPALV